MDIDRYAAFAAAACLLATAAHAQQQPAAAPKAFQAGAPLGNKNEAGVEKTMSKNVKVYGSFRFSESCTFDPARNLIVAMNAGNPEAIEKGDGFVSLINPDGSVHTSKWIGATRDGLTLNQPLGSAVANGTLYAVDADTVRMFDLKTGMPKGSVTVTGATGLNGIAAADDGTVYASNTGNVQQNLPQRIYKVTPDGRSSVFVDGDPLALPNGVARSRGQRRRRQHRQQQRADVRQDR
jgi:hypothetical protein